jgi:hypothetical protein
MWDPGGGRSLNSRLEAAPTESLSNGNLDFPDKQVISFYKIFKINHENTKTGLRLFV